jgi:phosphate transport system permease protein
LTAEVLAPPDTSERSSDGEFIDTLFARLMAAAALTVIAVLVATAVFLLIRAWPALSHYGLLSSFHSRWAPSEALATSSKPNPYGIVQFIYGTVVTSLVAMAIAVPVAIAVALYITNRHQRCSAGRCHPWSTCSRLSPAWSTAFGGCSR